jgi:septum formation protein
LFSKDLILASTSPYRRELLTRLGLPFQCVAPRAEESRRPSEPAEQMASRLARLKAETVAEGHPGALVIGSDQVAVLKDDILGKPGTVDMCREQLRASSGQKVAFFTAVYLAGSEHLEQYVDQTVVRFRKLTDTEINRYIERERPLDCAGGFKAEALGISLFDAIETNDPTGLTGLPLIWVCGALRRAGVPVP